MSKEKTKKELFNICAEVLEEVNGTEKTSGKILCKHLKVVNSEDGTETCSNCGVLLTKRSFKDQEWRFFGSSDTKHCNDPSRVQRRCDKTGNNVCHEIKERFMLELPENVQKDVIKLYEKITNGCIKRGTNRTKIIYGCVVIVLLYYDGEDIEKYKIKNNLFKKFNLSRDESHKGVKIVRQNLKNSGSNFFGYKTREDDVKTHIEGILKSLSATQSQIEEVKGIYDKCRNKDGALNRARPKSVASGFVFY